MSPVDFLSPVQVPPAPPSSPNLPSPTSLSNPHRFDAQRYPQPYASDLRTQHEDSFLQKMKDQLLDLSDLDERWLDAMDLEARTILYRAVLTIPLQKHLRLPDDEAKAGSSCEDKPLLLRPIPQRLWDRLEKKKNSSLDHKIFKEQETVSALKSSVEFLLVQTALSRVRTFVQ